jgi:hypothetical protein
VHTADICGHKLIGQKVIKDFIGINHHHHSANRRSEDTIAPHMTITTGQHHFTRMWHLGGLGRSVMPSVGLATLLVVVALKFQPIQLFHEKLHRRLEVDLEAPRPKMHTYYEKAKTDMTDAADEDLLANWKKAWWDAGWEPVIITQWDAMNLPEYDEMIDLIVDPSFIGQYNMQCYIRYLAMSAVGGGWMS